MNKEYDLATRIVHLEDALKIANDILKKNGKLGVSPDMSISFRGSRKFHKKVRDILGIKLEKQEKYDPERYPLYAADPKCKHKIEILWSGYKCSKCSGWYCA